MVLFSFIAIFECPKPIAAIAAGAAAESAGSGTSLWKYHSGSSLFPRTKKIGEKFPSPF